MRRAVALAVAVGALVALVPGGVGAEPGFGTPTLLAPAPGSPSVPVSSFTSISCATPEACTALGVSSAPGIVTTTTAEREARGRWAAPVTIGLGPESSLPEAASIACTTPASCVAVGSAQPTVPGPLVPSVATESAGAWSVRTSGIPVPPGTQHAGLTGIWCDATGSCAAVGFSLSVVAMGEEQVIFEDVDASGTWLPSVVLPLPSGAGQKATFEWPTAISCSTLDACVVVGSFSIGTTSGPFTASQTHGTWSAPRPVSVRGATGGGLSSVSCTPTGFCAAVGDATVGSGLVSPIAVIRTGAAWRAGTVLPEPALAPPTYGGALNSVSCVTRVTCVAVGELNGRASQGDGQFDAHAHPVAYTLVGSTWSSGVLLPLPSIAGVPAGGSALDAVACASAQRCEAVGSSVPKHWVHDVAYIPAYPYGEALAPVATITAPGVPTSLLARQPGTQSVIWAGWNYPHTDGGAPIVSFEGTATSSGLPTRRCVTGGLSCTFTGVQLGRRYVVQIRARNAAGALGAPREVSVST